MRQNSPTEPSVSEDFHIGFVDIVVLLARHWRRLLLVPLLVGGMAFGLSMLLTPKFTANATIMPPQQQNSAGALLGSLGGLASVLGSSGISGVKNPADQWIGMLKSRTIADALVKRFELIQRYDTEFLFQARDRLASRTFLKAGKDGLIYMEVDDEDPKRAADLASGYIEELQKMSSTIAVTEAAQRRLFFEEQLKQTKDKLVKAEVALKGSGVGASALKTNPEAAVSEVTQIRARIAMQEVKLATMRGALTDSSAEVRLAQLELSSLRKLLTQAEQSDPAGGSSDGAQYIERFREFKYQETLFELFARQYEVARADEAKEGAVIQVIDAAQVPEWKSSPKRALIAVVAAVLALVALVAHLLVQLVWRVSAGDPLVRPQLLALREALGRKTAA